MGRIIGKKAYALFMTILMTGMSLHAQIWKEAPLHRLTSAEYEMTLDFWSKKYKDRLTVEKIGSSAEGDGIFMLKISNKKVPDSHKQIALITALHGGPERSGTTSLLALTEWLLSDDREAVETRNKQTVLIIPIINPYSYFITDQFRNSKNIDPYTGGGVANWDFEQLVYKKLDESPEINALLKVVDEYKPDINLDFHGTGLQEYTVEQKKASNHLSYRGQIMFEVSGLAYSNSVLRPWDWRITEAMVEAGKQAGFPSDRGEADAQQLQWAAGLGKMEGQTWRGRPQFYTAQYGYLKYHTLLSALEVAWEASGVARAKGMLRIGNGIWPGEKIPGYPVNKVHAFVGRYVTSWGSTASQLRASRVELWQKQAGFSHGIIYPETEGRESYVVGLTSKGLEMMDSDLETFVSRLTTDTSIHATEVERYIKKGPEIKLAFEKSNKTGLQQGHIQNGLGLRLRIPYVNAKIVDIRVNGHVIRPGAIDGYETWAGEGYLQLQINIPPQKATKMDIAVVTCTYSPNEKRSYGWAPPKEVLDGLKKMKLTQDKN